MRIFLRKNKLVIPPFRAVPCIMSCTVFKNSSELSDLSSTMSSVSDNLYLLHNNEAIPFDPQCVVYEEPKVNERGVRSVPVKYRIRRGNDYKDVPIVMQMPPMLNRFGCSVWDQNKDRRVSSTVDLEIARDLKAFLTTLQEFDDALYGELAKMFRQWMGTNKYPSKKVMDNTLVRLVREKMDKENKPYPPKVRIKIPVNQNAKGEVETYIPVFKNKEIIKRSEPNYQAKRFNALKESGNKVRMVVRLDALWVLNEKIYPTLRAYQADVESLNFFNPQEEIPETYMFK